MTTDDLIQFNWKADGAQQEPVLITVDPKSSIVPAIAEGIRAVFSCRK
jgi:hypothetical protein